MASPNTSWTDILTSTLYHRQKTLADNVTKQNALLRYLRKGNRRRPVSGGAAILEHLEYQESTNFVRYSGYETIPVAAQELITAAEFAWKQAACAVTISGLEMIQNRESETRMLDLMEARIGNAEKTMMNNISSDCYSDGTASSSKQIGGLQLLVADTPTSGIVGGINRASYSFWQNYTLNTTASGLGTVTTTSVQAEMNTVLVNITRGADRTKVILMDNTFYTKFMGSLQAIQRITEAETGEAGFMKLKYAGIDVVMDGGYGGACPVKHAYFLNTDYISYRPAADNEFVPLDPDRYAVNQNALVKIIDWAGNMTLSNAFVQGVMFHSNAS